MVSTKLRPLHPKTADTKYTGLEPDWVIQPPEGQRQSSLMKAFAWYGYHYDKKTVKQLILDWMLDHDRNRHKAFAKVPESVLPNQLGWLCRMHQKGLILYEKEIQYVNNTITKHLQADTVVKHIVAEADHLDTTKVTIQDRLRAKTEEIAAELEGLYDEVICNGAKLTADHKPIAIIRGMNLPPQMIGMVREIWTARLEQLQAVQEGKDAALVEGYGNFNKIQLRNLVKLVEQVLADCTSYVQIKRVEKRPRKTKAVSPEHRARKFKHITEFEELKLTGLPAARLVNCNEAWLYDTKKRKLIHLVADTHIGSVTIKNNMLIGYGETDSQQKTLRKPAEILKQIAAASKPNARKVFKEIKTTETAYNGRGTDNLIILKVW